MVQIGHCDCIALHSSAQHQSILSYMKICVNEGLVGVDTGLDHSPSFINAKDYQLARYINSQVALFCKRIRKVSNSNPLPGNKSLPLTSIFCQITLNTFLKIVFTTLCKLVTVNLLFVLIDMNQNSYQQLIRMWLTPIPMHYKNIKQHHNVLWNTSLQ